MVCFVGFARHPGGPVPRSPAMSTPAPAYAVPAGRPWRRLVAAVAACSAALAVLAAPAAHASDDPGTVPPAVSDVTMVQANVYTGLTVPRFQADVAKVLSTKPDFVPYNGVMSRTDAGMAPPG